MAVCPHCGDTGAPPRGWCLLCGQDVSLPAGAEPPTAEPLAEVQPLAAVQPLESIQPLQSVQPVEPIDFDEIETAPAAAAIPVVSPTPERIPDDEPTTRAVVEAAERIDPAPLPAAVGLSVTARYEYSSVPAEDAPIVGVLVEIEASGQPLVRRSSGPVAHVILALDLSASMNHPDKYPVLRDAIGSMLDDLQLPGAADVLVSAVIFSRGSETLFRDVPAREIGKAAFFRAIETNRLCFDRYTDVGGALSRAGRIAYDQTQRNPRLPVRIYLLTDGKPQDGSLAADVARKVAKVPADLHGLAFGADADVSVLQKLFAGRRGGTVKSVRRETIGTAFERVAEVAQKVVATRCRVQLDLAPGVVGGDAYRYRPARVRFPEPAFSEGKRFLADLGTIERGRTYSLLFEVRPPETKERVTTLGTVSVQVPAVGGGMGDELALTIPRTDNPEPGALDAGVRTARDILGALNADDPQTALRALRLRRQLYEQEKRDPGLLQILDKAIRLLDTQGSLDDLAPGDLATLMAHTCTGSEAG